jgi:DNA-binding response OmpR family regulator
MSDLLALVVEEDLKLRSFLVENLRADGFTVATREDAGAALSYCAEQFPDLVVVSVNGGSGRALVKAIRDPDRPADVRLPVILMGCDRHELEVVRNLSLGADDYIVKPFSYPELLARARALLRRVAMHTVPRAKPVQVAGLTIDPAARSVTVDGRRVSLTAKTYALLVKLASDPTRVFTKQELLRELWGLRTSASTRTLDTHCCRLRHALGASFVRNVWGVGYRLIDP